MSEAVGGHAHGPLIQVGDSHVDCALGRHLEGHHGACCGPHC